MILFRYLIFFTILYFCPGGSFVRAEDWPRFRGLNGSGLSSGGEIPDRFDESTALWNVSIPGTGHGSPVVFGEHVYLLSAVPVPAVEPAEGGTPGKGKKGGKKKGNGAAPYQWQAICLDRETGALVWKKDFKQQHFKGHRFNSAASSTAAVDEDQVVFAWGTAAQLTVVSLSHGGDLQWEKDLGPVVGGHGFGGSPVLFEDLVVLNNDQEKQSGNLLALDASSGDLAWTVKRQSERISYSVPCVYSVDGRDALVFVNWQHGFTAIDPEVGSVIAEKSVFNLDTNERAISSPVVAGGLVIGTCGFTANPKHCVAMRLKDGLWEEVWRVERNVPHIPSVMPVGDRTFLIDDAGIATCLDTLTGEEHWRARIPGVEGSIFGSPVSDGEKILFLDESGNAHLIAVSGEFKSLGASALGELCRSTPALADGVVYIRTASGLRAYGK
ncbi:MAG: PQQ-binding-like beta-propeller repeat protein [Verrucomicrobiales bacterium]|nr:PQQ-binding-like beta-propeller repeat protein [Verrucomicrobiales bacterium]